MISYAFSRQPAGAGRDGVAAGGVHYARFNGKFVVTMVMLVLHAVAALLVLFFRALSRPASGHRTIVTDGFDDHYEQLTDTAPRHG
ncbi:hypothetical protein ACFVKB_38195 [Rhodococcus sp. NPDC127530]|uniref:hypothetical protein n=1 Tax=unclassified Rhodococcus (in: high G+C Gram-positive bacteria) TaxID=192944 RepID=UPI0036397642